MRKNDDVISRQAAIEYLMTNMNWYDEDGYESDDDYKRECIIELINGVPSAQPEPLTDKEQRIFLAAMRRERKVCTYAHEPCEVPLTKVCDEIVRKVKGALWTT